MDIIQAIILAIIEGITEYLPVSSTGHMILASSFMGIASNDFVKLYTVAIQFGAILSVLVLYWRRFLKSFSFYFKLLLGFIPAAIFGVLFNDKIDELMESPVVVAVSLLVVGILLLKADDWFTDAEESNEVTYHKAFIIGIFQCLAMIPGVSRSAATIIGGMTQKLTRKTAAEFSFFLAVPTMFAATAKKLFDFYCKPYFEQHHDDFQFSGLLDHLKHSITAEQIQILAIGNIVAFIVAILAIKSFVNYLSKNGFKIFGYYRIVLGIILLLIHFGYKKLDLL